MIWIAMNHLQAQILQWTADAKYWPFFPYISTNIFDIKYRVSSPNPLITDSTQTFQTKDSIRKIMS